VDSVSIEVGLKRVPPVAVNDYDTAEIYLPLNINVMRNDTAGDLPVVTIGICDYPVHGTATPEGDLTITYHADPEFSGVDSMRYYICDSGSPALCDTAVIYIYIGKDSLSGILVIYNVITPNGDGINDEWIIGGISEFPDNLVEIYNRWGDLVNSFERYDNTTRVWKGDNFRGNPLPDGTYYYIMNIKNVGTRTGWVFTRGGTN
jgi:gliding motility-associated-like protein